MNVKRTTNDKCNIQFVECQKRKIRGETCTGTGTSTRSKKGDADATGGKSYEYEYTSLASSSRSEVGYWQLKVLIRGAEVSLHIYYF
jgi:hypothetical protein